MKKLLSQVTLGASALLVSGQAHAATTDVPSSLQISPVTIDSGSSIGSILMLVINWALGISGAIAVIFLIYGGILYITAAGNADKAKQAKNTILYAVIGLVVILLSFAIVTFLNMNAQNVTEGKIN